MSKQLTIESEFTKLDQEAEIKEQRILLKEFLSTIKNMIQEKASIHLPTTLSSVQRSTITRPQVFISYAWEADTSPKLNHLQTFLLQLKNDFEKVGLKTWLDLSRMSA